MTSVPLTPSNARVKELRKLSRRSGGAGRGVFLSPGPQGVEGAIRADVWRELFATPTAVETYADLIGERPVTLVSDQAMAAISDAVSPAGITALCDFFDQSWDRVMDPSRSSDAFVPRLVAICADVRDPGNAGTVIRCADAAGADAIVLAGDAVDLYNPKTIRASVGSAFHVPIVIERDPLRAMEAAKAAGLTVLAADMDGESLFETDLGAPTAWLFGNEAWGLPAELAGEADRIVSIPIYGQAESLNLSTAAAVCLYASARAQRA
ncbi:TrmH family RNA methyltransferase [Nocardioides nematodiphilus]|uniref:TrmH family RNA methyltransferase n=1 Tax=Nocardioides nematodiphilus TaxID=2849669 RepID=UPI0021E631D1